MQPRPSPTAGRKHHPEALGRYQVLVPIAAGGMATVYLARSRGTGDFEREVALKLMHPHLRGAVEFTGDLVEEAKLAVRIRHPNVVPVLDVGSDDQGVFLVMDYIEGDSLSGLTRAAERMGGTLPDEVALRILLDALAGLHAAHELRDATGRELGVVHRDFSPHNILVGVDGIARLADFGIAKAASRLDHTRTGMLKGKYAYMAPEQARGQPLDRRCDVWAAGVLAWELLARRRLFDGGNELDALLSLVAGPPPPLRTVRPEIHAALERAVSHALTQDVRQRCPTADAFARELAGAAGPDVEIADHDEVARHVLRLAGDKLARRREAVAAIDARRGRTSVAAPVVDGPTHTETNAVSGAIRASDRRGPLPLIGILGAAALCAVVGAIAYRSGVRAAESERAEVAPAAASPSDSSQTTAAPVTSDPIAAPSGQTIAPEGSSPADEGSSTAPPRSSSADAGAPKRAASVAPTRRPKPATEPSAPPLVKNPYDPRPLQ